MKCKQCQEAGQESKVYSRGSTTTLLGYNPYWDEQGEYHNHNPNTITTDYYCSNGHRWLGKYKNQCPNIACDYGKEKSTEQ